MYEMQRFVLIGLTWLVLVSAAFGADLLEGEKKSKLCAGCHGPKGVSMIPMYPNLAGQKAPYIVSSLNAYKAQERKGGNAAIMWGVVASLSPEDIDNLAAFYASLGMENL
jgi:cytochrome c553